MKAARELLRIARELIGVTRWDEEIEGKNIRFLWASNYGFRLEEMPAKGKRRLRVLSGSVSAYAMRNFSLANMENIIRWANIRKSMTYDQAKKAIDAAFDKMQEVVSDEVNKEIPSEHLFNGPYEEQVYFLEIEPPDTKPFTVKGKDFGMEVSWTGFKAYSPDSDFQQPDPYYSYIEPKSKAAARKAYKVLRADPTALKGISYHAFDEWLRKNGIAYEIHHSVWR